MHMTDAEIRERSALTLLRIIARQEDEIEGLREALRDLLALHQAHHNHPNHAAARKALAKAERAEP